MAIYHLSVKIIGRGSGRSSVAAAAYRAGEKLYHTAVASASYRSGEELREHSGIKHDYTRKTGVVHTEIMLPDSAPREFLNRERLWNAVELAEKRRDARTAREVEVALPVEFDLHEQAELLRGYVKENFVDSGMCVDFAIHDRLDGNPHAHIMLTTRNVSKSGFGKKNRDWDRIEYLESWREKWADVCNERLKRHDVRIDHRTLEAQGLERKPTIHVGRSPERARRNEEIIRRNEVYKPAAVVQYMNDLHRAYDIVDQHLTDSAEKRREAEVLRFRAEDIELYAGRVRTRYALEAFARRFNIEIDDAPAEVARLRSRSEEIMRELKAAVDYAALRETIADEYRKQRLLAEIRPDSKEILDKLKRPARQLEYVTDEQLRRIAPELRPAQVRILEGKRREDAARQVELYDRRRASQSRTRMYERTR